jgi:hypothetical protein
VANRVMDESKNSKRTGHRFEPGNKHGMGRPQGSRNKATIALQALLDSEGEQVTRKAIELALAGDSTALRLVVERLIPPTKERPLNLTLPKVTTAADTVAAIGAVLEAVARGELAPGEGQQLAALIDSARRNIETAELEQRIRNLEQKHGG